MPASGTTSCRASQPPGARAPLGSSSSLQVSCSVAGEDEHRAAARPVLGQEHVHGRTGSAGRRRTSGRPSTPSRPPPPGRDPCRTRCIDPLVGHADVDLAPRAPPCPPATGTREAATCSARSGRSKPRDRHRAAVAVLERRRRRAEAVDVDDPRAPASGKIARRARAPGRRRTSAPRTRPAAAEVAGQQRRGRRSSPATRCRCSSRPAVAVAAEVDGHHVVARARRSAARCSSNMRPWSKAPCTKRTGGSDGSTPAPTAATVCRFNVDERRPIGLAPVHSLIRKTPRWLEVLAGGDALDGAAAGGGSSASCETSVRT